MPLKQEIIESLDKKLYTDIEVRHLLHSVRSERYTVPNKFKKGDAIVVDSGTKSRPAIVVKVLKDTLMLIPLSTTEDELNMVESDSRFFKKGYFGKFLITVTKKYARDNFVGVYDNSKALNKAIRAIKEYVNQI